jgi:pimeloyl-ACP methyl ester carboxylesterase
MIRQHAHGGQAHIVGISTGGFIAQELVRRHPDVVLSVFAAGCCPLKGARILASQYPKILHFGLVALLKSPNSMFLKVSKWCPDLQNNTLLAEVKRNTGLRLTENGQRDTGAFQDEAVEEIAKLGIRIAMIAAGQHDDIRGHQETAEKYRSLNHGEGLRSRAWVVRDAVHAWNLQYPELFARGIKAWIEGWPMPSEFELLE